MPAFPRSMPAFAAQFATEAACHAYLQAIRWPDGVICPRDGLAAVTYLATRGVWTCPNGHQTSVTAGTALHRARKPLCTWFWAAYLVATHTPGISALQLARQLRLRYETAYMMLQKLRAAMVNPEREPLRGVVEMDGTYIGSRKRGKPGRSYARGRYVVLAAVETRGARIGRVRLRRVRAESWGQVRRFVAKHVARGSTIRSDGLGAYVPLRRHGYGHVTVTGETSVDVAKRLRAVHLVFSNLKAWLLGTHHGVSGKHLQAYLNEFAFRFNRRRNPMAAFNAVLGIGTRVPAPTYRALYRAGWRDGWAHPNPQPAVG